MINHVLVRRGAVAAVAVLAVVGVTAPAHADTRPAPVPLAPGGRVSATVVDRTTGQPVTGACVVLVMPGRGGLTEDCSAPTDDQGRTVTDPKAPGTYQMFVYPPEGYGFQWTGPRGGTGDQREAARISVRAGRVAQAPTVRLDPPGAIGGVVRDPAGEPASGTTVAITAWGFGPGPSREAATTDEQGRYELSGLGPYAWPLSFTPGVELPRQWSGGVGNRFRAEKIRVRAGETTGHDTELARGSVLSGTVTVRGGAAVDFWRLTAVNVATGDEMGAVDSAEAGDRAYELPLAGPQQVKIRWDVLIGEEIRSGWWEDARDITTATPVTVPRSGVRTLDLTIG